MHGGAGVRWTPLPKAEAPTEPAGETQSPWSRSAEREILSVRIARAGGESKNSPVDCFLRGRETPTGKYTNFFRII